ncbi:5'-AMP-activated protein kinase subunit beta-1 [Hondaea fermentalgiana]|uniref:5'-AMP-activated protein kinase subunit beta-1 n=1 Tax=Hondaea fermentalgiana TaxID=2315210 RepID=A0A2R5GDB8_9STRA|nr:5'-AMP-activated protein kinase subunit beta-1 [Hondaea fermentalgiana]|eukprot:GBG26623.1 5'-AMP-activated protein kinase subunit beta-1 [Hondaea fermentalgiana]
MYDTNPTSSSNNSQYGGTGTGTQDQQQQQQYSQESDAASSAPRPAQSPAHREQIENASRMSGTNISEEEVDELLAELERDDKIPMVFRWDGGGRNVYITGTFNRWTEKIPMRRSGNDFLYIRELKRGKHAYKFIVDDEWRFAPEQPTVADPYGNINNFVDLSDFKETYGADMKSLHNKDHITDDSLYGNFHPDPEDPQWYAKEPPPLPPHLRHIILNTPQTDDCLVAKSMQVPEHVTLNHLYCSAIKENLMVLGVTQRYKEKFVTTVFYSPLPDAKIVGRAAAAAEKLRARGAT